MTKKLAKDVKLTDDQRRRLAAGSAEPACSRLRQLAELCSYDAAQFAATCGDLMRILDSDADEAGVCIEWLDHRATSDPIHAGGYRRVKRLLHRFSANSALCVHDTVQNCISNTKKCTR